MFEEEIISDGSGYIERGGYMFTCLTYPSNIYDALYIKNIKNKNMYFGCFRDSKHTLEEHVMYINSMQLEKASIFASDLKFLRYTPTLKYLSIALCNEDGDIDYSSIYEMPQIKSLAIGNYDFTPLRKSIDYSKINGLEDLYISGKGHTNYENIETLKSLTIEEGGCEDLNSIFTSQYLDTLYMIKCGLHSLDGIENSKKMQCLYLHYNRSLRDINALSKVKKTLRALRIENCPKIEDFSVLGELENLELLELTGKNSLPDLQFIKKMKNLKTFVFDMNVMDGDLSPCLDLSYVHSRKNRKHYNVKDKEMPRGKYVRGNESIELWRRME